MLLRFVRARKEKPIFGKFNEWTEHWFGRWFELCVKKMPCLCYHYNAINFFLKLFFSLQLIACRKFFLGRMTSVSITYRARTWQFKIFQKKKNQDQSIQFGVCLLEMSKLTKISFAANNTHGWWDKDGMND